MRTISRALGCLHGRISFQNLDFRMPFLAPAARATMLLLIFLTAAYLVYFFDEPTTRFRYYYHAHFDAIYNEQGPVDVVFTGSSRAQTMFGAHHLKENIFGEDSESIVYNMSTSQRDIGFQYIVLRELLERRRVGTIFLEVNGTDRRPAFKVHPFLYLVARQSDVWESAWLQSNQPWPLRVREALQMYFRKYASVLEHSLASGILRPTPVDPPRTAATRDLLSSNPIRPHSLRIGLSSADTSEQQAIPFDVNDPAETRALAYLAKLKDLATRHNTKLFLLYVPQLSEPALGERQHEELKNATGLDLISPRGEDLKRFYPAAYADRGHGSSEGRRIYAEWLGQRLRDMGITGESLKVERSVDP